MHPHSIYYRACVWRQVCAKIRLYLYGITCPRKGPFSDTSAGQCALRATAQVLQQPLLWGWEIWHADPTLCISAKVCLKHVIQWLLLGFPVSWKFSARILCHIFVCKHVGFFLFIHTHTQIASPQVMIYLPVGSKFILRTSLNIFMLAKSISVRVKIAREEMWERDTFPFLILKIIFLLD